MQRDGRPDAVREQGIPDRRAGERRERPKRDRHLVSRFEVHAGLPEGGGRHHGLHGGVAPDRHVYQPGARVFRFRREPRPALGNRHAAVRLPERLREVFARPVVRHAHRRRAALPRHQRGLRRLVSAAHPRGRAAARRDVALARHDGGRLRHAAGLGREPSPVPDDRRTQVRVRHARGVSGRFVRPVAPGQARPSRPGGAPDGREVRHPGGGRPPHAARRGRFGRQQQQRPDAERRRLQGVLRRALARHRHALQGAAQYLRLRPRQRAEPQRPRERWPPRRSARSTRT